MTSERETGRVAVRTYVPAYQKAEWAAEADDMGMSQAEFVRTMVQAGRRDFELGGGSSHREEPDGPDVNPGVDGLEDRVLDLLQRRGTLNWDELVTGLTDDIEDRLDEVLDDLQEENRIKHSGRHGGYRVVDDGR
jgi:hypothetical protein